MRNTWIAARKYALWMLLALGMGLAACRRQAAPAGETAEGVALEAHFLHPPDSVKPWMYWYWISDNISGSGITRDLETMSKIGIGEAFIGNIGLNDLPYGKVPVLSPDWWRLTRHAFSEASRLGMRLGLFNCPGWSQSGGPWIKPDEAMRYLVHRDWIVHGPARFSGKLSMPYRYFRPVALQAFPAPEGEGVTLRGSLLSGVRAYPSLSGLERLFDGDTATAATFPPGTDSLVLELSAGKPFVARSLSLFPGKTPFAADCILEAQVDGRWQPVDSFLFDRSNSALNVGPMPFGPVTVRFGATTAARYRITLSHIRGTGSLSEVSLDASPRLSYYIEKQLGKMHQTPHPMWDAYEWPAEAGPGDQATVVDPGKIRDLTGKLTGSDSLQWDVPEGTWVIELTGMTTTGVTNAPAPPEATGLEVDKMNVGALKAHFNAFVGRVLDSLSPAERKSFAHVVEDSYETGSENWTDGFGEDFKKAYGYDPKPWLPVLSGRIVGSADQSNRFLWDLRRLVATKVAYDYAGALRKLSEAHGLKSWLENYGHWGFPSEFLLYGGQSDDVAGEFWAEGDLGSIELRDASSAAHIYGKREVWAESWTAAGRSFMRYPAMLKQRGDWAFTEGINHTLLHVNIEQPGDSLPGMNAWFGTEFNRHNTWFPESDIWIDYLRRAMFMLQRGQPVGDVLYYIGEDAPKMAGIRDPEIPRGYSYDYINADAIENRLSVSQGRLVLPDGVSYRVLVLPPETTMRPEVLEKIGALVRAGAVVLGNPPSSSPSLAGYPRSDSQVRELAQKIWQGADGVRARSARYGAGTVYRGESLDTLLNALGVPPDLSVPAGVPVDYIHRHMADAEIYFLTNQSDSSFRAMVTFRVTGKAPELWDPLTGETRALPAYRQSASGTAVPLDFGPSRSWFVVFRHAAPGQEGKGENFPKADTLLRVAGPWEVTFDPRMGGPASPVLFDSLYDWSRSSEDSIRYYSGTAVYRTHLRLGALPQGAKLLLDLGKVSVLAHVKVNGRALGGAWTDPWQVDVTGALHAGDNTVEVRVVNLWVNRLIGESKLPAARRRFWSPVDPYKPDSPLVSSGLLGPVRVEAVRYSRPDSH